MLVWTRGPVWISSGESGYWEGEKLHGTWCEKDAQKRGKKTMYSFAHFVLCVVGPYAEYTV